MKVLLVSLYHPELVRGGAQTVAYELFRGLRELPEIEPVLLASADQTTPSLFKSGARITGFDGRENEFLFLAQEYDHGWEKSGSALLAEAFEDFLRLIAPDVVHFHHFMTFGIDFLTLARRVLPAARIVFTAHEFLTICAADGHMLRRHEKALCGKASPVRCHQCLPERPPEQFFLREMWMKRHLQAVDAVTVPSRFMIRLLADWGLAEPRLTHVTNALAMPPAKPAMARTRRNRFGFFGQLVDVKGLQILLRAVSLLRAEGFLDFCLEINGGNLNFASAECRGEIEAFLAEEQKRPAAKRLVQFNGGYHQDQLPALMARVDWCVVPSLWWEAFCLVLSEAWHCGRPVIATDAGGLAERVTDGKDGLLFPRGDERALAETMKRACTEEGLWSSLAAGIKEPARREEMVLGYLRVYREGNATAKQRKQKATFCEQKVAKKLC
jgi:glycosyltransferase involved in cell wall biosynthesis